MLENLFPLCGGLACAETPGMLMDRKRPPSGSVCVYLLAPVLLMCLCTFVCVLLSEMECVCVCVCVCVFACVGRPDGVYLLTNGRGSARSCFPRSL